MTLLLRLSLSLFSLLYKFFTLSCISLNDLPLSFLCCIRYLRHRWAAGFTLFLTWSWSGKKRLISNSSSGEKLPPLTCFLFLLVVHVLLPCSKPVSYIRRVDISSYELAFLMGGERGVRPSSLRYSCLSKSNTFLLPSSNNVITSTLM